MAYEILERYIDRALKESTPDAPFWNLEKIRQGKKPHWNYIDGCMMNSLWRLYQLTGDKRYMEFVDSFMDFYISDDGTPLEYDIATYNLDNICPGQILFELYKETGKEKYSLCIDLLMKQLKNQPRTYEGNFWHKLIYPNQVWLDGLYMAQVFYVKYALANSKEELINDTVSQFETVRKRLYVEDKKLYCHGYDASKTVFWADKETGRSPNFWLRAIGWYSTALVDILEVLDKADENRKVLEGIFKELMESVAGYADSTTGIYYQVVDQGGREGNYLETSGSAMIAYAMLKGTRIGILDKEYIEKGKLTFDGIYNKYLKETSEGLNLQGICLVAGLGPENDKRRDGSYEYYISEPVVENDAKGVAPFIMCYTEVIRVFGKI